MTNASSSNQKQDSISLDVQLEHEELDTDENYPQISPQKDQKSIEPFSWLNVTRKRIKLLSEGQENHDGIDKNEVDNLHFSQLEKLKTKTMTVAITISMLPLLISSAAIYYFGNQSINRQTYYTTGKKFELLGENIQKQRKMLLFLLTGAEVTALSIGIFSALWAQRTIARVARVAIQANNLAEGVEKKQQSQILAQIVSYMRQSIEREDIMRNATREARKVLKCDRVLIYLFNSQFGGSVISESVASEFSPIMSTTAFDLGLETKYISDYQNNHPRLINNVYQERELEPSQLNQLESFEIKSLMHVPLEQQGEIIGLLIAHQCSAPRSWQPKEIELFNQIALEIGLALDDAQSITDSIRLQKQLAQESQWQDYLSDSIESIHSSTNEEDLLKMAVEEPRRVLKCDRVAFYHFSPTHQAIVVAESVADRYEKILGITVEKSCFETECSQKYQSEPIFIINDINKANLSFYHRKQLEVIDVKALIAVPIIHQNQLYGLLVAHQCSEPRFWQESEIKWFTQMSKQIGYALDNAKLMVQVKEIIDKKPDVSVAQPEEKAIIKSQLPIFLQESKNTLEKFSQKVLAEVDAVTPVFKQMQVMANSVQGLTDNINQTKLQSQQVDSILRSEYKNIDLTEDRFIAIQRNLKQVAVKNINLGQSCQQFIEVTDKISNLAEEINLQVANLNHRASEMGLVDRQSLQEQSDIVYSVTEQLARKVETLGIFLNVIKEETLQITTALEESEEKAFVGIEMVQETRQNFNYLTTRNQEINHLIERITLAATIGEQNSQLAQQSLMEVANLANQAAKKSVAAINTIASLTKFLQKL